MFSLTNAYTVHLDLWSKGSGAKVCAILVGFKVLFVSYHCPAHTLSLFFYWLNLWWMPNVQWGCCSFRSDCWGWVAHFKRIWIGLQKLLTHQLQKGCIMCWQVKLLNMRFFSHLFIVYFSSHLFSSKVSQTCEHVYYFQICYFVQQTLKDWGFILVNNGALWYLCSGFWGLQVIDFRIILVKVVYWMIFYPRYR